jgi:hypothetical protein
MAPYTPEARFAHARAKELAHGCARPRRWNGTYWRVPCPAHEGDHGDACSITPTKQGVVRVKCRTGCSVDRIVQALGFTHNDLCYPVSSTYTYTSVTGATVVSVVTGTKVVSTTYPVRPDDQA